MRASPASSPFTSVNSANRGIRAIFPHLWYEILPDVAYDSLEELSRAVLRLVPGLQSEPLSDAVLVAAVAVDPIPVVAYA